MRIHFVVWSLELGGAQASLVRLTDELAHDHEVAITAFSGSGAEFFQLSPKVTYRSLGPNLAGRGGAVRLASLVVRWFRLVRTLRAPADVVVSFLYSTTFVTAPACAVLRRPLVAAERTDLQQRRFRSRWLLLAVYRKMCVLVVVQSDALGAWLAPRIGPTPVAVIPNAMPDITALPVPVRRGVVALGRFDSTKGFDLLVEAAARMTSGRSVDIYGTGPDGHQLRMLIDKLGVGDRVRLHPPTDNPAVALASAEVLAVPSLLDGFPNVVLEAFALSTPVVATITTGARAIDGGTGAVRLVERSAAALALALDATCEDNVAAAEQAARATQRARAFDRHAIAQQWSAVLEQALASANGI
ncbi:MAG: glycosyltransferase [Acidimicrobiales bacterium]|nr:glycosyltransferase [Acidimicrobiales bacterium]